jgi:hypothetical protein
MLEVPSSFSTVRPLFLNPTWQKARVFCGSLSLGSKM